MTSRAGQTAITGVQADDHERRLALLLGGLKDRGQQGLLVDFHGMTLRASNYHNPTRGEPELNVFWSSERDGIALTVRVAGDFYDWGWGRHS